jgi:hypothetical protein
MKKLILFSCVFLLFWANGKAQITIHTDQVKWFHELMKYSEEKAGGKLNCRYGNETELQAAFDRNANDVELNLIIDSLLKSDLYMPESVENTRTRFKEAKGKEAYRVAFTIFPDFCIDMSAGLPDIWVRYWNRHEFRSQIADIIIELNANKKEIIESIKTACKMLLPDDVDMDTEVNIHIIADGNRGYFQFGNNVMMDIIYFDDFSEFLDALKHEMHHAYYRKWFTEKTSNKERNESEEYLYQYQESFILEGIAQRLDYDATYSYEYKQMYANEELITELFDEWITLFRALKGDSPQTVISIYEENEYEKSIERGKKYYPGKDKPHYIRPTAQYFLSYHIYNSIFEIAGQKKLKYVIENPDKLLLIYNELHTDSMIVPRIPDDIVRIWQESF